MIGDDPDYVPVSIAGQLRGPPARQRPQALQCGVERARVRRRRVEVGTGGGERRLVGPRCLAAERVETGTRLRDQGLRLARTAQALPRRQDRAGDLQQQE